MSGCVFTSAGCFTTRPWSSRAVDTEPQSVRDGNLGLLSSLRHLLSVWTAPCTARSSASPFKLFGSRVVGPTLVMVSGGRDLKTFDRRFLRWGFSNGLIRGQMKTSFWNEVLQGPTDCSDNGSVVAVMLWERTSTPCCSLLYWEYSLLFSRLQSAEEREAVKMPQSLLFLLRVSVLCCYWLNALKVATNAKVNFRVSRKLIFAFSHCFHGGRTWVGSYSTIFLLLSKPWQFWELVRYLVECPLMGFTWFFPSRLDRSSGFLGEVPQG